MADSKHSKLIVKDRRPYCADNKLCSVEVDSPTQLRDKDKIGLIIGVWFDILRESVTTDSGDKFLSYGFRAARLEIETSNCKIGIQNRYNRTPFTRKVETSKTALDSKTTDGSAKGSVNLPKILGIFEGGLSVGGGLGRAVKESKTESGELVLNYRAVWSAGHNYWRMSGIENENGVLVGQVTGEEPLCEIVDVCKTGATAGIKATLEIDFHDLWVESGEDDNDFKTKDDAQRRDLSNRNAVCSAILKKRFVRKKKQDASAEENGRVVDIATAGITIRNGENQ